MPVPSQQQLREWAERYVALWNAGDKEGWIRNWRSVAPGEFRMLDPVGTPEKRGFERCCARGGHPLGQPRLAGRVDPVEILEPDHTRFLAGRPAALGEPAQHGEQAALACFWRKWRRGTLGIGNP
jgi:hypothetical protein